MFLVSLYEKIKKLIIIDHRTNITLFGIPKMLNGEYLEQFIEEFEKKQQNEKLKALMEDLNE